MSKKWKKPGAAKGRTPADPKPTEHCHFDPTALQAAYVKQATDDEKWKAVQKIFWRKQLKYAACLNILTAVAAGVGFAYGLVSFCMWRTMINANEIAQRSFRISEGAYVSIGRQDGVIAEFKNANLHTHDGVVMYFQNSGHMPAKLKWGLFEWHTKPPSSLPPPVPFVPMSRTRNKKTGDITENLSTDGAIGGQSIRNVQVGYLPPMYVNEMLQLNAIFTLDGAYEYCDELGTYSCKMFEVSYQNRPFGSFSIDHLNDCPADRGFVGYKKPGPDEEELPLCELKK
jgi:hypothetical protein